MESTLDELFYDMDEAIDGNNQDGSISNRDNLSNSTPPKTHPRLLMRVKYWDGARQNYGKWKNYTTDDTIFVPYMDPSTGAIARKGGLGYRLKYGGTVKVFPDLLAGAPLDKLIEEIDEDPLYRQYTIQTSNEPRLHFLLSSDEDDCRSPYYCPLKGSVSSDNKELTFPQNTTPTDLRTKNETPHLVSPSQISSPPSGYKYHGIKMKPVAPMSRFPSILRVSKMLAAFGGVETFSIGGNVILYRNGRDGISWHADDTQEEEIVSCLVAECPGAETTHASPSVKSIADSGCYTNCSRPLKIKRKLPNGATKPEDGDEFIELWVGRGDGYEMDSLMQDNYVHALPKSNVKGLTSTGMQSEEDFKAHRRIAIVFRHGRKAEMEDSGKPAEMLTAPAPVLPEERHPVGSMPGILVEGNIYSRLTLVDMRAHSIVQGGVSGTTEIGCRAIVVSRQDVDLMEADCFHSLLYTSNADQGVGAMFTSWTNNLVIRVFRSSKLNNPFRALKNGVPPDSSKTLYRYDGLYRIKGVCETEHFQKNHDFHCCAMPEGKTKSTKKLYTCLLVRVDAKRIEPKGSNEVPFNCLNSLDYGPFVRFCCSIGTLKYHNTLPGLLPQQQRLRGLLNKFLHEFEPNRPADEDFDIMTAALALHSFAHLSRHLMGDGYLKESVVFVNGALSFQDCILAQIERTCVVKPMEERKIKKKKGRWNNEEHHLFLTELEKYGYDFEKIAANIPTRTPKQVRCHARHVSQCTSFLKEDSVSSKRKVNHLHLIPIVKDERQKRWRQQDQAQSCCE